MMPSGPLSYEGYDDKIMLDHIKKKMDARVKQAENEGIKVETKHYTPEQAKEAKYWNPSLPLDKITGNWHSSRKPGFYEDTGYLSGEGNPNTIKSINVPRTPSLLNHWILEEEYAHATNPDQNKFWFEKTDSLPSGSRNYAELRNKEKRYAEEKRAKELALKRVGGHLHPRDKKEVYDYTKNKYLNDFLNSVSMDDSRADYWKQYYGFQPMTPEAEAWIKSRSSPLRELVKKHPEIKDTKWYNMDQLNVIDNPNQLAPDHTIDGLDRMFIDIDDRYNL